jgi:hypothetical protein
MQLAKQGAVFIVEVEEAWHGDCTFGNIHVSIKALPR